MDDTKQVTGDSVQATSATSDPAQAVDDTKQAALSTRQDISQPTPAVPPLQQTTRQIEQPGISGHKELAPVASQNEEGRPRPDSLLSGEGMKDEESMQPTHPEVKVPPEVKEAGVEKQSDAGELKLDKQVEQAGVTLAKENTLVSTEPSGSVQLPMTYMQAVQKKKKSGLWNSVTWLAGEIAYQWKKLKPDVYE